MILTAMSYFVISTAEIHIICIHIHVEVKTVLIENMYVYNDLTAFLFKTFLSKNKYELG